MLVMVYGTLMKDLQNHNLMTNARFVGNAKMQGQLYHLPYGYPALVSGNGWIRGEIYEIDKQILEQLDILEEYEPEGDSNLYNRTQTQAILDSGEEIEVNIYFYRNQDEARKIGMLVQHGDWKDFTQKAGGILCGENSL